MNRLLVFLVGVFAFTTPALAEMSADNLIALLHKDDVRAQSFIQGMWSAYVEANELLHVRNQPLLFCMPYDLFLTVDQQSDLLAGYVVRMPAKGKGDAKTVFMFALIEAYPCK
jgi:hypothetical protein